MANINNTTLILDRRDERLLKAHLTATIRDKVRKRALCYLLIIHIIQEVDFRVASIKTALRNCGAIAVSAPGLTAADAETLRVHFLKILRSQDRSRTASTHQPHFGPLGISRR